MSADLRNLLCRCRSAALVASSLVSGFLISIFELACTGQVYFPTIAYMVQSGNRSLGYLLLGVYNFGFIVPLLAVFFLAYAGVGSERITKAFQKNIGAVKLGLADLFEIAMVNTGVFEVIGFDASITDISCGGAHSVVLDENGNVWTWGAGETMGYDDTDDVDSTKPIPYLDNIRFVASSGGSLIVYTNDGILYYMDDGIDPTLMEYEESGYISDDSGNDIILRESDIRSDDRNLQVIEGGFASLISAKMLDLY